MQEQRQIGLVAAQLHRAEHARRRHESIQPGEPLAGSAYEQPHQLPRHLDVAVEKLMACKPLADIFGQLFIQAYSAIKDTEYSEYFDVVSPWERRFLLLHV